MELRDLADPDLRIMGTMTMLLTEALPSFHFEGDHLVTLDMIDDLGLDDGLDILSNRQRVAISQEHFAKLNLVTGVTRDTGNIQSLVLLNLELLPGYFYDC